MNTLTPLFCAQWIEARTRFEALLLATQPQDLPKRLGGVPNSAGFLIRHVAEVELLFAKNVFGKQGVQIVAKTVMHPADTGEWVQLAPLKELADYARAQLLEILTAQTDADWQATIVTKEFGSKTKAEALGRILSHTAYHAGQLALTLKYGSC
jgi:uncharacterized damage-inducible protein DinB